MSDTLEALYARVEAAQALAAKATPGPFVVHPPAHTSGWGVCVGPDGLMIARMTGGRGSSPKQRATDAALLAAAPDLVTLAADLLALAEAQAERINSALCMLCEGPDAIGGLEARDQAIKILRGDK